MRRAYQLDSGRERGNHNGGVIRFGDDAKLYVIIGDNGRRGQTQNLENGPFGPGTPDDQFGGPEPDDAHLTGVILRLNDDGTTPDDNPFYAAGAAMGGPVGANVQKIFAYGIRNSFGMDVDPVSGDLWKRGAVRCGTCSSARAGEQVESARRRDVVVHAEQVVGVPRPLDV
jgi:glucose/arabinose dehydrogenase